VAVFSIPSDKGDGILPTLDAHKKHFSSNCSLGQASKCRAKCLVSAVPVALYATSKVQWRASKLSSLIEHDSLTDDLCKDCPAESLCRGAVCRPAFFFTTPSVTASEFLEALLAGPARSKRGPCGRNVRGLGMHSAFVMPTRDGNDNFRSSSPSGNVGALCITVSFGELQGYTD
jgi:hypothetical protein